MKTRLWCEFVPPEKLCSDSILHILEEHGVILNYKLDYGKLDSSFFSMLKRYNQHNIPVSLWLTLSDEDGYWVNERNAAIFQRYVKDVVQQIKRKGLKIQGICIDMEPPLEDVLTITNSKNMLAKLYVYSKLFLSNVSKRRYRRASNILKETAGFIRSEGLESYGVGARYCYYDLKFNSNYVQNALETPFFNIPWDKYNLMYYATIIRDEHKKRDINVNHHIYKQIRFLEGKLGDKLAISVGLSNIGKLGTEPFYEDLEEFKTDMGILKACGVEDISIYSLDGLMNREKLERFLEAVQSATPYEPEYCPNSYKREKFIKKMYKVCDLYHQVFGRIL